MIQGQLFGDCEVLRFCKRWFLVAVVCFVSHCFEMDWLDIVIILAVIFLVYLATTIHKRG